MNPYSHMLKEATHAAYDLGARQMREECIRTMRSYGIVKWLADAMESAMRKISVERLEDKTNGTERSE